MKAYRQMLYVYLTGEVDVAKNDRGDFVFELSDSLEEAASSGLEVYEDMFAASILNAH